MQTPEVPLRVIPDDSPAAQAQRAFAQRHAGMVEEVRNIRGSLDKSPWALLRVIARETAFNRVSQGMKYVSHQRITRSLSRSQEVLVPDVKALMKNGYVDVDEDDDSGIRLTDDTKVIANFIKILHGEIGHDEGEVMRSFDRIVGT